ncbi:hypothetical protein KC19_2G265300 [Ceratodon purpureus]|uniref:Uncharacterized protein n=1 Tax=Ceratodon purpureus TaxID=3225 RepID=A0A8T0J143_CERPU|nr:hypothetical protein KC19_2G265300 [Ceratodon purpureus]
MMVVDLVWFGVGMHVSRIWICVDESGVQCKCRHGSRESRRGGCQAHESRRRRWGMLSQYTTGLGLDGLRERGRPWRREGEWAVSFVFCSFFALVSGFLCLGT